MKICMHVQERIVCVFPQTFEFAIESILFRKMTISNMAPSRSAAKSHC